MTSHCVYRGGGRPDGFRRDGARFSGLAPIVSSQKHVELVGTARLFPGEDPSLAPARLGASVFDSLHNAPPNAEPMKAKSLCSQTIRCPTFPPFDIIYICWPLSRRSTYTKICCGARTHTHACTQFRYMFNPPAVLNFLFLELTKSLKDH